MVATSDRDTRRVELRHVDRHTMNAIEAYARLAGVDREEIIRRLWALRIELLQHHRDNQALLAVELAPITL